MKTMRDLSNRAGRVQRSFWSMRQFAAGSSMIWSGRVVPDADLPKVAAVSNRGEAESRSLMRRAGARVFTQRQSELSGAALGSTHGANRRLLIVVLAVVGAIAIAGSIVLFVTSRHRSETALLVFGGSIMAASFMGTGLFAWWRRPHSRVGLLMYAVGAAGTLKGLYASDASVPFGVGLLFVNANLAVLAHLLVAFPAGRLNRRSERLLIVGFYVALAALSAVGVLFQRTCECVGHEPRNVFLIANRPGIVAATQTIAGIVLVVIALSIGALLVRRWHAASGPLRRIIAPVLWTGAVIVALLSGLLLLDVANAPGAARQALIWLTSIAISAVPFAFLAGLLRSSYSRADVVGDLIARLHVATSSIRDAIAAALRDPSLELIYWRTQAGRYVTADGRPAQLPSDGTGRGFIEIKREGQRMAAIIFDAMLAEEPKLVAAVSAAGALALDNERLQAELRARITELELSRARVLDATLRERQRIERDLHDGAQQRFVSVAMELGVLDRRLTPLPEQRELLRSARKQLESGISELRELARGIHPALLTGRGLGPAVQTLAERVPLDVRVVDVPDQRLPTQVEVAAYFIVSESLTNAVRHAHAAKATVRVGRENGTAIVEVADDGVGGADPARGSGLRGLIDRLAALDGELVVHSPVGDGTRVEARIPCA